MLYEAYTGIRARLERARAEASLHGKMDELTRFSRAIVHRNRRMIELKKQVNQLAAWQGKATPYPLAFEQEGKISHDEPAG